MSDGGRDLKVGGSSRASEESAAAPTPGKATLTSGEQAHGGLFEGMTPQWESIDPGEVQPVQRKGGDAHGNTHAIAAHGVSGSGGKLPHADAIATSFGEAHAGTVQGISAHIGGKAADATGALGAQAYATGNSVAFGASPDLHTAAHEAAHVVQQKSGAVQLKGGVGAAGDGYEQHADAVADRVVQGKSAVDLLEPYASGSGTNAVQAKPVQFIGKPLGPGEEHRELSVADFIAQWEAEHGRKITKEEKDSLDYGCVGVSVIGLGVGATMPSTALSFSTFEQAKQVQAALNKILAAKPAVDKVGDMVAKSPDLAKLKNVVSSIPANANPTEWRAAVFSKRFFSRQTGTWEERKKGDDTKFTADKNGQVDMTGDKNIGRADASGSEGDYMVNFDYGWWDESTGTWFHANHADPGMIVYQSTLTYYSRPLRNFDRQVFCVAFARTGK